MKTVKCSYCGSHWHIEQDHIKAKSKGGKTTIPACQACNRSKSNKSLKIWLDRLRKENLYRLQRIRKYSTTRRTGVARKIKKIL